MSRTWIWAAATAVLAVGPVSAGPDIIEDCTTDTGSLPGAATPARGPGPTVNSLRGCLSGSSPFAGPSDLEDMYLINIEDPLGFQAVTLFGDGTSDDDTTFNAQLWLFAGPGVGLPEGVGLLGNQQGHDALPPGSAALGSMANDGTDVQLMAPGLYYLAISEVQNVPRSFTGDIFLFDMPFEVSGPDGPGGGEPIVAWSGDSAGNGGGYTIFLEGVAPVPLIPGDTNGDDVVDVNDLNHVVLDWGTDGARHGGDIAGANPGDPPDGIVDVNDLNAVIVNWS